VIWLGRRNPKVLLYHDCSDEESAHTAGLDCTISPGVFELHVTYLSHFYNIVDFAQIEQGTAPQRSVALTFDDGYRSVYDNAFPILRKFDCPAIVYLVTNVVDNEMVWVNEINFYLHTNQECARGAAIRIFELPAESTPEQIITALRLNYSSSRMDTLLNTVRSKTRANPHELSRTAGLYLDWEQITEMQRCGISFGNHTMSHPNLARLTKDEQTFEIAGAQDVINKRIGCATSLAYPFGHLSDQTANIASGLGLTSMAEVGGTNFPLCAHKIGRVHVSATTHAGLFAQMEVVEPIKAHLRKWLRFG
jgi:peptidoglycan/xylan/chitin deacetylase (PgdA/CDA1 family)